MLKRFLEIKERVLKADDDEIIDLAPCLCDVRKIEKLSEKFRQLDLVSKELQNEMKNLADVRYLFDTVIDAFGNASNHLDKSAKIVHDPCFESCIVKILSGQTTNLKKAEGEVVISFLVYVESTSTSASNDDNYMEKPYTYEASTQIFISRCFSKETSACGLSKTLKNYMYCIVTDCT